MKKSLFLLPLTLSLGAAARADLTYTQTTSSPFTAMMGGGASAGVTTKIYTKGDANRSEARMFGRTMITIGHGAQNVIQIDPATKTYTSSNSGSAAIANGMMPSGAKRPSMSMTVSTKNLGTATINGVKAPHYRVDMAMKMAMAGAPQNIKMAIEIWGSQVPYPVSAKTRADALKNLPDNLKSMFGPSANISGDVKGMAAAYKTVPLQMKMFMNGNAISTITTTGISTKPLPASLFSVPAGYRQISNEQFGQMQRAAMQKSVAGMMGQRKN